MIAPVKLVVPAKVRKLCSPSPLLILHFLLVTGKKKHNELPFGDDYIAFYFTLKALIFIPLFSISNNTLLHLHSSYLSRCYDKVLEKFKIFKSKKNKSTTIYGLGIQCLV